MAIFDPDGVKYFLGHYKGNRRIRIIYIECSLMNRLINLIKRGSSLKGALSRLIYDSKAFKGFKKKYANVTVYSDSNKETLTKMAMIIGEH